MAHANRGPGTPASPLWSGVRAWGQFPPLQGQCKYMVGNAFVNTFVNTGVVLKECVFQPQQGKSTRAQALPGRSPPALGHRNQSVKVKLVPHSTIFHESKEARK